MGPTAPIDEGYSVRWAAPEILRGEVGVSKEADIYSLGMVLIEVRAHDIIPAGRIIHQDKVFSGAAPFADSTPTSVTVTVLFGERPERPKDPVLTDGLWDLTRRCLEHNPQHRPEITDVVDDLREALVDRKEYVNVADVARSDGGTSGSIRHSSYCSSFIPSHEGAHTGLNRLCCSMLPYRLWRCWKPIKFSPEPWTASDRAHSIVSKGSGHSLCSIRQLGELCMSVGVRSTPYDSRKLLRMVCSWLLNRGASSTQDCHPPAGTLKATACDATVFKRFRQLRDRTGLLPTSHIISNRFIQTTERPVASCGFGDVWQGIYHGKRVSIKVLHVYKEDDIRKVKKVTDPTYLIPLDTSS